MMMTRSEISSLHRRSIARAARFGVETLERRTCLSAGHAPSMMVSTAEFLSFHVGSTMLPRHGIADAASSKTTSQFSSMGVHSTSRHHNDHDGDELAEAHNGARKD